MSIHHEAHLTFPESSTLSRKEQDFSCTYSRRTSLDVKASASR